MVDRGTLGSIPVEDRGFVLDGQIVETANSIFLGNAIFNIS